MLDLSSDAWPDDGRMAEIVSPSKIEQNPTFAFTLVVDAFVIITKDLISGFPHMAFPQPAPNLSALPEPQRPHQVEPIAPGPTPT